MPQFPNSVQSPFLRFSQEKGDVGRVFLVGAGPGDPGLLTIRGRECLEMADFVLYDGLANPILLDYAVNADCISVGKHGESEIWTQQAINAKMMELAQAGNTVVRLKGGDPAVFARTAEELEVLAANAIPFEVVPGITAALAAASYAGIPITHRHHASAVALITGQQQTAEEPQAIDWRSLANFPGTLVFYMGVTTVERWTRQLIDAGKPASSPAAIVRRCSWSDQQVVRCTLGEVPEHLTPASKMRPPVIVIVGEVAELGSEFDWFSTRTLKGCGIWIPRPKHQTAELERQLKELGADVYCHPAIEIRPPQDFADLKHLLQLLHANQLDGITFSSSNGVDGFFEFLQSQAKDTRLLAGVRLAAVGPATARRLERYGLICDVVPSQEEEFSASGLIRTLGNSVNGETWAITTTNLSRDLLAVGLQESGAKIINCRCYETTSREQIPSNLLSCIKSGKVNFVLISSSSLASATHQMLGKYKNLVQPIALSDAIAQKLQDLDWPAVRVAEENSSDSLIAAVCQAAHPTL